MGEKREEGRFFTIEHGEIHERSAGQPPPLFPNRPPLASLVGPRRAGTSHLPGRIELRLRNPQPPSQRCRKSQPARATSEAKRKTCPSNRDQQVPLQDAQQLRYSMRLDLQFHPGEARFVRPEPPQNVDEAPFLPPPFRRRLRSRQHPKTVAAKLNAAGGVLEETL